MLIVIPRSIFRGRRLPVSDVDDDDRARQIILVSFTVVYSSFVLMSCSVLSMEEQRQHVFSDSMVHVDAKFETKYV